MPQDNLRHKQMNKQGTLSCQNVLSFHERHQSSCNRGSVASQQVTRMFSSKNPDDSLEGHVHSLYIPPPLCISIMFVTSLNDIMIVCFPFPVENHAHVQKSYDSSLCTCQHPYWTNLTVPIATHKLTCQFHIPTFEPVTYVKDKS